MAASRKTGVLVPIVLCALVGLLWGFPKVWYTQRGVERPVWFTERTDVEGWNYTSIPIASSAEKVLVADRTVNGEFRKGEQAVRVFSAKRYQEKSNEIGLFVHTPDRCWVESGWKVEPVSPDLVEVTAHGVRLAMERRVFDFRGQRELVYFCGLVGGQSLPYRLDHNLSVGMRTAFKDRNTAGSAARASDAHFWKRLWASFVSRRELAGPKQFLRISTQVRGDDTTVGDKLLQEFITQWLAPGNYEQERAAFNALASK
jgi:hypothetical protein